MSMVHPIARPPRLRGIPDQAEARAAVSEGRLLVLGLMTSRQCDLRCQYCYTSAGLSRRGELGAKDRVTLIAQAADLGARLLWVPGEGEPLLDSSFWPMVEEAARRGLWTLFYTSGTQVTTEIARRIADSSCSVVVKLNSLRPEVQDQLAGRAGVTAALRLGLDRLIDAGLAADGRLGAETVVVPQNIEEIPEIFRYCRDRGIIPYVERLLPTGRGVREDLQLPRTDEDASFRRLAEIDRDEYHFDWDSTGMFAGGIWNCDRIFYTLVVDATGGVHSCVSTDDRLGHAPEENLASIWRGSRLAGIRDELRGRDGQGVCYCREHLMGG